MKTLVLCLLAVLFALCLSPPAAIAQPPIFELSCPAGYASLLNLGKTFNASTGQWRANFCISTNGNGRMICQADGCGTPTTPFNIGNAACSTLNSGGLTDAGCAAVYNSFVLRSIGSTANNMRHGFNNYFETDLHQVGAGNEFYSHADSTSVLLDAGSTGAGSQRVMAYEPVLTIQDIGNSGTQLLNADIIKSRVIVAANVHVSNVVGYLGYLPTVAAGAVVTNLWGSFLDNPVIAGTVTNSVGYGSTGTGYKFGGNFGGSVQAMIAEDSSANTSGICHATTFTVHDCYFSGSGSPEGVVTANVGSTYARQDGGAGTSTYYKESGTGNTGWVERGTSGGGAGITPHRTNLGSDTAVAANTQTSILSKFFAFPSSPTGVTYHADIRYGAWVTADSNACAAFVKDETNSIAFALSGQDSNGGGFMALTGSEITDQTYTPGQAVTFTLKVICNMAQTVTIDSGLFTLTPNESTWLSVTPMLAN